MKTPIQTNQQAKRAVIYMRSATEDQDGPTIAKQRRRCEAKTTELGATIEAVYIDAPASGTDPTRPGLAELRHRLSPKPKIDYVIVERLDRLARNCLLSVQVQRDIEQADARLISVSGELDETPTSQLMHSIVRGMAAFASAAHGEAVRTGIQAKRMEREREASASSGEFKGADR